MIDINKLTIKELHAMYTRGDVTVREVVDAYLKNIEQKNGTINAFLEVYSDIDEYVEKAQQMIDDKNAKFMTGVPVAIKDNMLFEGHTMTAGSKILEGYVASYTSSVVQSLLDEGAVILGRTNMDEMAMGSSTETSAFGITSNPLDEDKVPGGSSGGSAASVAGNMALVSLGSDTGGSIRQPAAFCGLVGLKSTYGTVSRYGITSLASSLDQIGPLAKNVDDAEILFNTIFTYDKNDSTCVPTVDREKFKKQFRKKIGIPRKFVEMDGLDPKIKKGFDDVLNHLKNSGYEIVDVDLPTMPLALAVYYVIQPAEASSNFARFDGIRYGYHPHDLNAKLGDMYSNTRTIGFGKEVRRRMVLGALVLSKEYSDVYGKAFQIKQMIQSEMEKVLNSSADGVDVILTPTTPSLPFAFGEKSNNPVEMYLSDVFAVPANITGAPAISIPVFTEKDSVFPIGVQAIGSHFNEEHLFTIGRDIESFKL